jgi:AICAR transformylase/IMP cyclohydrolase PurH
MFETDNFKNQLRAAISAEAVRNGLTYDAAIVEYLQKLASENEKDLMERELRKSVGDRRGIQDALRSATELAAEAARNATMQKSNNLSLANIQDAYRAKFCRVWPFCK